MVPHSNVEPPISPARSVLARYFYWASAVLLAFEVGGGLYEHLVLDAAWPANLELIQPARDGVNRATFWMLVHSALSLSLLAGLWSTWPARVLRRRMAWTLGLHLALRAWSFAYFIPAALKFEAADAVIPEDARTWILLSPLRTALTLVALVILWRPGDVAASFATPGAGVRSGLAPEPE